MKYEHETEKSVKDRKKALHESHKAHLAKKLKNIVSKMSANKRSGRNEGEHMMLGKDGDNRM